MWLMKDSPSLLIDLYELTMAQVYFKKPGLFPNTKPAYFEVSIRRLPENWGFFVMAGLNEVESYLREFRFRLSDTEFLRSTGRFSDDFLEFLGDLKPDVSIRCLPEGTVFFPNEPVLEVAGPLICAQLMETYILNILGFSIIEATLAARTVIAAAGAGIVDFGLRRCQGPIASLRAARGGQMAGFAATSNVFAARKLDIAPSGTMAHSFIHVHDSEEQAFRHYADAYGQNSILLVDTYDSVEGIKKAAAVAKELYENKNVRIAGIRIDSGDLAALSRFARIHFREQGVPFMKIFASGDLDEFKIEDLLKQGAQIDGFGIGTNFSVSRWAPAVEIVYKIVQYGRRPVSKTSPCKETRPGRKTITRIRDKHYKQDIVYPLQPESNDLLAPFESVEPMPTIRKRLATELALLEEPVKAIRNPREYFVEFAQNST